jgi:hypothetical protein
METIGDNSRNMTTAERLAIDYASFMGEIEKFGESAKALPETVNDDESVVKIAEVVKTGRELLKAIDNSRTTETRPHLDAQKAINGWFGEIAERVDKTNKIIIARADEFQRRKAEKARRAAEEEARKAREEQERQRAIVAAAEAKARAAAEAAAERGRASTAAEEKARAAASAAAAKAQAAAEEAAQAARRAEAEAAKSAADTTRVRSGSGTVVSAKTEFNFRITDYEKIDLTKLRHFIKRDAIEAAIRSLMKVQGRSAALEGVEFFEDVKSNIR